MRKSSTKAFGFTEEHNGRNGLFFPISKTPVAMNRTGCAPGLATDTILFYANEPSACDMSVNVYIVLGALISFGKLVISLGHSYLWIRRAKNLKAKQQSRSFTGNRIPIVPLMSWIFLFTYLIFFTLTSTDNSTKGEGNFFFGFGWLIFGASSLFYLMKFVSLGHRLVPKNHLKLFAKAGEKLSKLSRFGKFGVFVCIIILLGQTITMCIVGLIFPLDYTVIRIANGFYASFLSQFTILLMDHFQRVKTA